MTDIHTAATVTWHHLQCLEEVGRVVHHTGCVTYSAITATQCRRCPADDQLVLLLGEHHSLRRLPRRTADIAGMTYNRQELAFLLKESLRSVQLVHDFWTGYTG